MNITITGSLGNIGQHLAKKLIADGHNLTIVSSNEDRKAAIVQLGARAAIGSITDAEFLVSAFDGADAVFVMTPPNMGGSNIINNTVNAGKSYLEAIKKSGVKRVVMLSSIGAELAEGNGPIRGLHQIEKLYGELTDVNVTYLRAGYFYTNFYNDVPLIKNAGIQGSNFPADTKIPLVHPSDIATAAAEELQKNLSGHSIRYIVSDYTSAADIAQALGKAIGNPKLNWVEFTDQQSMQGMVEAGIPDEIAAIYTEMGLGIRNGKLQADFESKGRPVTGSVKLNDFAIEFAKAF